MFVRVYFSGAAPDPAATEIPMPGVKADILAKIVAYMEHHRGVEPPTIEKPLRSKVRGALHRTSCVVGSD